MRVKTLIFAIALSFCGGSTLSSDTTEQNQDDTTTITTTATVVDQDDTTTTTTTATVVEQDDQVEIPDAPSVNFDIQEIYNTKLVVELCSDAKDIDNTSEECLKQYLANLEIVFSEIRGTSPYKITTFEFDRICFKACLTACPVPSCFLCLIQFIFL